MPTPSDDLNDALLSLPRGAKDHLGREDEPEDLDPFLLAGDVSPSAHLAFYDPGPTPDASTQPGPTKWPKIKAEKKSWPKIKLEGAKVNETNWDNLPSEEKIYRKLEGGALHFSHLSDEEAGRVSAWAREKAEAGADEQESAGYDAMASLVAADPEFVEMYLNALSTTEERMIRLRKAEKDGDDDARTEVLEELFPGASGRVGAMRTAYDLPAVGTFLKITGMGLENIPIAKAGDVADQTKRGEFQKYSDSEKQEMANSLVFASYGREMGGYDPAPDAEHGWGRTIADFAGGMAAFINPLGLAGLTFKAGVKGAGGLLAKFGAETATKRFGHMAGRMAGGGATFGLAYQDPVQFDSGRIYSTGEIAGQYGLGQLKALPHDVGGAVLFGAGMSALHAVAGPAFYRSVRLWTPKQANEAYIRARENQAAGKASKQDEMMIRFVEQQVGREVRPPKVQKEINKLVKDIKKAETTAHPQGKARVDSLRKQLSDLHNKIRESENKALKAWETGRTSTGMRYVQPRDWTKFVPMMREILRMPEGKQLLPEPGRGRVGRVTDELFDKLFRRWREKDWESGQPPPSGPSAEAAARAKPVGSGKSTGVSKAQQRAEDHLTLQEIGPQLEGLMRPKEFGFPKVDPPPEAPEAPTPGETLGRIGPQLEGLMHPKEFPESAETPKLAVQRLEGEIKELKQSIANDPPKKDPDSEEDPFDVREVELLLKESDLRGAQEKLKRLAEEAEGPPAAARELPEPGSDEFYRHGNQGTIPEKLAEVPHSDEWQAIAEARFPNYEIDGGGHVKNPEIIPVKPLARVKGATASIKLAETDEGTWAMGVDKKIDNQLGGGPISFDPTTFPTREAAIRQAIDTIKHWFNAGHVSSKFKDKLGPLNESLDKWLEEYFAKPEGPDLSQWIIDVASFMRGTNSVAAEKLVLEQGQDHAVEFAQDFLGWRVRKTKWEQDIKAMMSEYFKLKGAVGYDLPKLKVDQLRSLAGILRIGNHKRMNKKQLVDAIGAWRDSTMVKFNETSDLIYAQQRLGRKLEGGEAISRHDLITARQTEDYLIERGYDQSIDDSELFTPSEAPLDELGMRPGQRHWATTGAKKALEEFDAKTAKLEAELEGKDWYGNPPGLERKQFIERILPQRAELRKNLVERLEKFEGAGQGDAPLGTKQFVSGLERTPTDMKSVIEGGAQVGIKIGMGEKLSIKVRQQLAEHVRQGGQVFVEHGLYGPKFDGLSKKEREDAFFEFFYQVNHLMEDVVDPSIKKGKVKGIAIPAESLYVVLPDKLGDPEMTAVLVDELGKGLADSYFESSMKVGVNFIYVAHNSGKPFDPTKSWWDPLREIQPGGEAKRFILGIPANKQPWSPEEVAVLVKEFEPKGVHLLGVDLSTPKGQEYEAAIRGAKANVEITADAAIGRSVVNKANRIADMLAELEAKGTGPDEADHAEIWDVIFGSRHDATSDDPWSRKDMLSVGKMLGLNVDQTVELADALAAGKSVYEYDDDVFSKKHGISVFEGQDYRHLTEQLLKKIYRREERQKQIKKRSGKKPGSPGGLPEISRDKYGLPAEVDTIKSEEVLQYAKERPAHGDTRYLMKENMEQSNSPYLVFGNDAVRLSRALNAANRSSTGVEKIEFSTFLKGTDIYDSRVAALVIPANMAVNAFRVFRDAGMDVKFSDWPADASLALFDKGRVIEYGSTKEAEAAMSNRSAAYQESPHYVSAIWSRDKNKIRIKWPSLISPEDMPSQTKKLKKSRKAKKHHLVESEWNDLKSWLEVKEGYDAAALSSTGRTRKRWENEIIRHIEALKEAIKEEGPAWIAKEKDPGVLTAIQAVFQEVSRGSDGNKDQVNSPESPYNKKTKGQANELDKLLNEELADGMSLMQMFDDAINKTTEGLVDETPRETPETIIESETKGLGTGGIVDEPVMRTSLGRRDTSKTARIVEARKAEAADSDPEVIPQSLLEHLSDHQQRGVALAIDALGTTKGFLNADGTGVGKTRQILAIAEWWAKHREEKGVAKVDSQALRDAFEGEEHRKSRIENWIQDYNYAIELASRPEEGMDAWRVSKARAMLGDILEPEVRLSDKHNLGQFLAMWEKGTFNDAELLRARNEARKNRELEPLAAEQKKPGPVLIVSVNEALGKPFKGKKPALQGSYVDDGNLMGVDLILTRGEHKLEPGKIYVTTYTQGRYLRAILEKQGIPENTLVIFDEAHALKNWEMSGQAKAGLEVISQAEAVMFATATPADKPTHLPYLAKMGILEGKSHEKMMIDLGMQQATKTLFHRGRKKKIPYWRVNPHVGSLEVAKRIDALFGRMTAAGKMIKREIALDGMEVESLHVPIPEEAMEALRLIEDNVEKRRDVLMAQRRQLEFYKVPITAEMVMEELALGHQVVVFASRVNFSAVQTKIKNARGEVIDIIDITGSEGTAPELKKELIARGVSESDIAELHGGVKPSVSAQAAGNFQKAEAKVLIATIQSGGTGINLDDRTGASPRAMIIMTAPFSAVDNMQAVGRIWRLTTASNARVRYVWTEAEVDYWNAKLINTKMKSLGAVVKGETEILEVDPELITIDDYEPGKTTAMGEKPGMEPTGEQARAPPDEMPKATPSEMPGDLKYNPEHRRYWVQGWEAYYKNESWLKDTQDAMEHKRFKQGWEAALAHSGVRSKFEDLPDVSFMLPIEKWSESDLWAHAEHATDPVIREHLQSEIQRREQAEIEAEGGTFQVGVDDIATAVKDLGGFLGESTSLARMKEGDASAQDFFGELRILRNETPGGRSLFNNSTGQHTDRLAEGLRERGFEVETGDQVIDLVTEQLTTGKPIFPRGMVQEPAHPYEGSSVHALVTKILDRTEVSNPMSRKNLLRLASAGKRLGPTLDAMEQSLALKKGELRDYFKLAAPMLADSRATDAELLQQFIRILPELQKEDRRRAAKRLEAEKNAINAVGQLVGVDVGPTITIQQRPLTSEILGQEGFPLTFRQGLFSEQFIKEHKVDFLGKRIRTWDDFVELAQVLRNPAFEQFYVYGLNAKNEIVGVSSWTSRMVNAVHVKEDRLYRAVDQLKANGATGWFMSHNHPTGDVRASDPDINMTRRGADVVPKMKFYGHVIIDHGKYTLIRPREAIEEIGNPLLGRSPIGASGRGAHLALDIHTHSVPHVMAREDMVRKPILPGNLIGRKINDFEVAVEAAELAQSETGMVDFVFMDQRNQVVGLASASGDDVGNAILDDYARLEEQFRLTSERSGAWSVIAIWKPPALPEGGLDIVRTFLEGAQTKIGILRDLVVQEGSTPEGAPVFKALSETHGRGWKNWLRDEPVHREVQTEFVREEADPYNQSVLRKDPSSKDGYTDVELRQLDKVRIVQMPELVRLVRFIMGELPQVKKLKPSLRGFARSGPMGQEIVLNREIFRNADVAAKVLAHELGHIGDFLGGFPETMERGNILGRIASLFQHLTKTMPKLKGGSTSAGLTPKDRSQIRRQAEKQVGPRPKDPAALDAWKDNVKDAYKDLIAKEIDNRGLITAEAVREELIALSDWWKPIPYGAASDSHIKYRESGREIYADAWSVLLNSPRDLKERAPIFWESFWSYLENKPHVQKELFAMWAYLTKGPLARIGDREARLIKSFKRGDDIFLKKFEQARWWHRYTDGYFDLVKSHFWDLHHLELKKSRQVKANGGTFKWDDDPEFLWDEHPFADNKTERFVRRIAENVIFPLEAEGLTGEDMGLYLFYNRILQERFDEGSGRSQVANPDGIQPKAAREALLRMRAQTLGAEKFTALEFYAHKFQDIFFELMTEAQKVGLVSRKEFRNKIAPNKYNYAAFATLERLEDMPYIPSGIKRSVGTLKEGANPFMVTIMKGVTLARAIQWQRAKKASIEMRQRHFPGEVKEAEFHRDNRGQKVFHAPPLDLVELPLMEDGKLNKYWVDEFTAQVLERVHPSDQIVGLDILELTFRGLYYPFYILYNIGFQWWLSPMRDFNRTWKNLPIGVSRWRLFKEMVKRFSDSRARMKGEAPPIIREMTENYAFGTPYDTFAQGWFRQDVVGKLLRQWRILPERAATKFFRTKLGKVIRFPLRFIPFGGQIMEGLPKIAAYSIRTRDLGEAPREAAKMVRNYSGVPRYEKKGKWTRMIDILVPFANVSQKGAVFDAQTSFGGTGKKRAGAWWTKWALSDGMFMFLKWGALIGLLGPEAKKWIQRLGGWDFYNYNVIPLGTQVDPESGEEKSVYLRIPLEEFSRWVTGVISRALFSATKASGQLSKEDERMLPEGAGNIMQWTGDQTPQITPGLTMMHNFMLAAAGKNPTDEFGNNILTADVQNAGGWHKTKEMLYWGVKETGATNLISWDPEAKTGTEIASTSIPLLNRILRVSNRGEVEAQERLGKAMDKVKAEVRLEMPENVQALRKEYNILSRLGTKRTPEQDERLGMVIDQNTGNLLSIDEVPGSLRFWHKSYKEYEEFIIDCREHDLKHDLKGIHKQLEATAKFYEEK